MVKELEEDRVNPSLKKSSVVWFLLLTNRQQLKRTACDRHEWLQLQGLAFRC